MNDNSNNYDNNNNRTGGAVFKVRGPVTTPFEVEEGRGGGERGRCKFGCSLFVVA